MYDIATRHLEKRRVTDEERKLDHDMKQRIIGQLQIGAELSLAARANEISRQAIYQEAKIDLEFSADMQEARAFADETIIRSLFKRAQRETGAAKFWLTNRRTGEWAIRHHHAGTIVHDHITYRVTIGEDGHEHHQVVKDLGENGDHPEHPLPIVTTGSPE